MSRPRSKYAKTDVRPAIGAWLRDAGRLYRRTDDVSQKKGALPMPLDLSKPVQTRDGRKVRILCTDAAEPWPVVGVLPRQMRPGDFIGRWDTEGRSQDGTTDIVNAPDPSFWLNIYERGCLSPNADDGSILKVPAATKDEADERAAQQMSYYGTARIACIEVKYRPGQGIE